MEKAVSRRSKAARPCDTCRRRKSRCVKPQGTDKCFLCTFHQQDCTYSEEAPQKKKRRLSENQNSPIELDPERRLVSPTQSATNFTYNDEEHDSSQQPEPLRSLLDQTLGLHPTIHSRLVGTSSIHEPYIRDLFSKEQSSTQNGSWLRRLRCVDDAVTFETCPDHNTLFHADDKDDLDQIEQVVHPHGPALVHIYFRIVHPSYPILHKKVFLEKYSRSYREFSPPLLAAVYLLALNWWDYDRVLSPKPIPNHDTLVRLAAKTIADVVYRPKLSTVQAGLLFLQRPHGDSWVLTSQLVAVGEELGLQLDCSTWNVPDWERGLRKRLAWALYMQDKWSALIYGRPSHINNKSWAVQYVTAIDFPESAADEDDEDGSTGVEKGRTLFQYLIRLSEILAEILELLYSGHGSAADNLMATGGNIQGLLDAVRPISLKLRGWASDLPTCLSMEDMKTRKLCSNGYLHLSYYIAEISIHRSIIRALHSSTGISTPEHLVNICREAAKMRLVHATRFVESLRPEHLQSFWWFVSAKSLALVGTYGALLWATSRNDEDAQFYHRKIDDYRWTLKLRSRSVSFVEAGIEELSACMPPELDVGAFGNNVVSAEACRCPSLTTVTSPQSSATGIASSHCYASRSPTQSHDSQHSSVDRHAFTPVNYGSQYIHTSPIQLEGMTPRSLVFNDPLFMWTGSPDISFGIDGHVI